LLDRPWFSEAKYLTAVKDVSLTLKKGQTIGVVGESGSGKSTLGRAILRLINSEGKVAYLGKELPDPGQTMRPLRRELQFVFQDPFGSLSPRMTIGRIITEGLLIHEPQLSSRQRDQRAEEALAEVGLDTAMRNRYPHELSGGQRQRVAIARTMILKPNVIVLDEPTSALDRSVQKQIVTLLRDLQRDHGLSYIFISHDMAVVRAVSDYVIVMKEGQIVEQGPTADVFDHPQEAYTKTLMEAALSTERFG
jgi:ABC-type microcin C transport system duplicated ATPase subunit YejF